MLLECIYLDGSLVDGLSKAKYVIQLVKLNNI